MAETNNLRSSQLDLASMKDPDGEGIRQALQKIADKIEKLENERRLSRMKVESLGSSTSHSSAEAAELFHRLAKAEARCNVLQRQLAHVRKLVREATILNTDDLSLSSFDLDEEKSARSSHRSTNSDSLSSVSLDDVPVKDSRQQSRKQKSTSSTTSLKRTDTHIFNSSHLTPPGSILDVPVYNCFLPSSNSTLTLLPDAPPQATHSDRSNHRIELLSHCSRKTTSGPKPNLQKNNTNGIAISSVPVLHFQKECRPKCITSITAETENHPPRECQRKVTSLSNVNTSYASTEDLSLPSSRLPRQRHRSSSRQRHRSSSRQRSGATTPLGRFLVTPQNMDNSHYHVKMHDIPFCSTTTSGKTHSLGANLQNLMSMVKSCHPALCNAAALHKRRSRSSERLPFNQPVSMRRNLSRWNSASELNGSHRPRRSRSRSVDRYSHSRVSPRAMDDLDLIPVKLKQPQVENAVQLKPVESCETPGNVCIRTEIKPLTVGCNKVVEVKMTTSAKPKCDRFCKTDTSIKRRQLLKNVREIQYMVENDQFE